MNIANRIRPKILSDKKVSLKMKRKFYKTVVRPTMIYGFECGAINKKMKLKAKLAEMRMLRRTYRYGVTRMNEIRNTYKRGSLNVANMAGKMRENRLRRFGRVKR